MNTKRLLTICCLSACLGYSWCLYYTRPYPNKLVEGTWKITASNGTVYRYMRIQTASLGMVNAIARDGTQHTIAFFQMEKE